MIKLDINEGDIIRVGRFKNKRIKVKDIGTDDYGLPTINGKGILKIRIEKLLSKENTMKLTKSQFHQILGCLVEEGRNDLAKAMKISAGDKDITINGSNYKLIFIQNRGKFNRYEVRNLKTKTFEFFDADIFPNQNRIVLVRYKISNPKVKNAAQLFKKDLEKNGYEVRILGNV